MTKKYPGLKFMGEDSTFTPGDYTPLTYMQIAEITEAIMMLGDALGLGFDELTERLSPYITEDEFEQILTEIENS